MKIINTFLLLILISINLSCSNNNEESTAPPPSELKTELMIGERIDGTANIRDSINGNVIIEFYDNILVECGQLTNDWYQVGAFVNLKKEQSIDGILKKGTELTDAEGNKIGIAKKDIDSWMIGENNGTNYGFIAGYTYKQNIKPESIAELELEKILNSNKQLKYDDFVDYLKKFKFQEGGLEVKDYKELRQFFIYGSWIEDPSPIDRIRVMFFDDTLISIIHERDLNMKNKKSYPLVRDLSILIIKDFQNGELIKFLENNKNAYNGVD